MHTKGPWKATLVEASEDLKHTVKYPVYWKIESSDKRYLASFDVYRAKNTKLTEAQANARLIAAAPELLDALEYIAQFNDAAIAGNPTAIRKRAQGALDKVKEKR